MIVICQNTQDKINFDESIKPLYKKKLPYVSEDIDLFETDIVSQVNENSLNSLKENKNLYGNLFILSFKRKFQILKDFIGANKPYEHNFDANLGIYGGCVLKDLIKTANTKDFYNNRNFLFWPLEINIKLCNNLLGITFARLHEMCFSICFMEMFSYGNGYGLITNIVPNIIYSNVINTMFQHHVISGFTMNENIQKSYLDVSHNGLLGTNKNRFTIHLNSHCLIVMLGLYVDFLGYHGLSFDFLNSPKSITNTFYGISLSVYNLEEFHVTGMLNHNPLYVYCYYNKFKGISEEKSDKLQEKNSEKLPMDDLNKIINENLDCKINKVFALSFFVDIFFFLKYYKNLYEFLLINNVELIAFFNSNWNNGLSLSILLDRFKVYFNLTMDKDRQGFLLEIIMVFTYQANLKNKLSKMLFDNNHKIKHNTIKT